MKKLLVYVGGGASLGFLVFLGVFLKDSVRAESLRVLWSFSAIMAILVAAFLYALIIPVSAWAWSQILSSMGERWSVSRTMAIMGVSQLAKYVPGNVAQHLGRASLSVGMKMNPGVFFATVFIETLFAVVSALLVGAGALALSGEAVALMPAPVLEKVAGLGLAVVLVGLGGAVLLKQTAGLRRRFAWVQRWVSDGVQPPDRRVLLRIVPAYCLNYAGIGLGVVLVSRGVAVGSVPGYLYLTAVFSIAWLAGFLAPGLPAGLGAREGVMALLLDGLMAREDVLNVLVGMRLATVLGDLLCFVVGVAMLKQSLRRS